jgi:hypothetical protein
VEYVYYALFILAPLAICLYMIRRPGEVRLNSGQSDLAELARRRRKSTETADRNTSASTRRQRVLNRELRNIPTPWGWPGSEVRVGNGLSGSGNGQSMNGMVGPLQQWLDRLISEKRTIDDGEYLSRRDASLRAMIEDRFGRSANRSTEMVYQPVRAPLLRDPSRPYDQMDNFPSGRTDRIVAKLQRQPGTSAQVRITAQARANVPLRDIKTPWGW